MTWVGLKVYVGWVGLGSRTLFVDWIGLGWVEKLANSYMGWVGFGVGLSPLAGLGIASEKKSRRNFSGYR